MSFSPLISELIEALRALPGVGQKSAQRMAFQLIERDRGGARRLASALLAAAERMGHCERCRTFSETRVCTTCEAGRRDDTQLCVVETPIDQLAIETATGYRGRYFVLLGRLSPLDGLGPTELGLHLLARRLGEGQVKELIIATNPTVEGEATAHYLAQIAHDAGVCASRIAHGVPIGGELEFVDRGTLAHAFGTRHPVEV